jgi:hypothetical protein
MSFVFQLFSWEVFENLCSYVAVPLNGDIFGPEIAIDVDRFQTPNRTTAKPDLVLGPPRRPVQFSAHSSLWPISARRENRAVRIPL